MAKLAYFQAPNFDINPDSSTAPKLGSIFPNLDKITGPLNQDDYIDIPKKLMNETSNGDFTATVKKTVGVAASLNANIAQGIGGTGDLVYAFARNTQDVYQCELLETLEFEPTEQLVLDFIHASPRVRNFLENSLLGLKRVYMITGLKVATGFSRSTSKEVQNGPKVNVGVDATAFGIPVEAGPSLDLTIENATTISHGRSTTKIVFAYRAIKIKRRRKGDVSFRYKGGGKYTSNEESDDNGDSDDDSEQGSWDIEPVNQEERSGDFSGSEVVQTVQTNSNRDFL
ncbi:hypothetical protein EDB81DRAFT_773612 [Dactylonectria macrodidyma]|uniref:Uncharacterized protein n=1 Tax=Dactylonectria macrodidyma TaxID=307937 RepID=A0A9P9FWV6_9HYPO|nr:hypothetical protein EDB81DRAFT_773612 [Dactylonectria macrodidyma]